MSESAPRKNAAACVAVETNMDGAARARTSPRWSGTSVSSVGREASRRWEVLTRMKRLSTPTART